ncbi:MAG: hypothetical protein V7K72_21825 [Nostoc sp.]|uniref:hypothetical protein n=1 Tax=Nostoc sp. TaxID=1180 RepID=UPI002FF78CB7
MTENQNQPREYDAVFGGQVAPPVNGLVLGGLEGVKLRLNSNDIKIKISAFTELIKYGGIGLDLLLDLFQHEKSEEVKKSAYLLLRYQTEAKVKNMELSIFGVYHKVKHRCDRTFIIENNYPK